MQVETFHWKRERRLAEDYIHRFAQVAERFDLNPWNHSSWTERAEWLDQHSASRADRDQLAAALEAYYSKFGNSAAVLQNIERLRDDRALVVIGGQQAGLFTGPLYVIHKAITILQTAKQMAETLNRPVIPIFWIAGEDHDFDEVNHTYVLSPQSSVEKIKMDHPTGLRSSVSQIPVGQEQWTSVLEQLDRVLMNTEFKPRIMDKLRQITQNADTLVEHFSGILDWLFGEFGLVQVSSDDPGLRRLESPMLARIIKENRALYRAFSDGSEQVAALGFHLQAEMAPDQANLFLIHEKERTALFAADGGFADRKGALFFTTEALLDMATSKPEYMSNNVLTRPLMQDYVFPVLSTILGPGEIAYWGQTREAFHLLDMSMPIILPRLEFTLLEGTLQKHLQKFQFTFEDVVCRFEQKKEQWLNDQDTLRLEEHFAEVKEHFNALYQPVIDTIATINPGLKQLGETNTQKIMEQIHFLETRSIEAFRSKFESSVRQLERIQLSVLPMDKPQERVYNVLGYLNKYGNGWLRELILTPLEADGLHHIVYL